jgi:hypothetical protein
MPMLICSDMLIRSSVLRERVLESECSSLELEEKHERLAVMIGFKRFQGIDPSLGSTRSRPLFASVAPAGANPPMTTYKTKRATRQHYLRYYYLLSGC